LDGYLDGLGLATGRLMIFDRRADQPPIARRTTVSAAESPARRPPAVIRACPGAGASRPGGLLPGNPVSNRRIQ